jgi:hypothetical protein
MSGRSDILLDILKGWSNENEEMCCLVYFLLCKGNKIKYVFPKMAENPLPNIGTLPTPSYFLLVTTFKSEIVMLPRKRPNGLTVQKCSTVYISLNLFLLPIYVLLYTIGEICPYKYFLYLKKKRVPCKCGSRSNRIHLFPVQGPLPTQLERFSRALSSIPLHREGSRAHFSLNLRGFLEPSQEYHYTERVPEPTPHTT